MSKKQLQNNSSMNEVPCMLLPMVEHTLLIPTTTVAEMSPMKVMINLPSTPEWVIGLYEWRNLQIPVISIESINHGGRPPVNPQGRVAVLNNTGATDQISFIGIHTQGIPRMTRVSESDIAENADIPARAYDLHAVKVGMEEFYLPDVTKIQLAVADLGLNSSVG